MDIIWQELVKYLGAFAIFAAALAWLTKTILTHLLSRDLENHKIQLDHIYKSELERLKHQLELSATEHNIRFGKLHEKRADVMIPLHTSLTELYQSLRLFMDVWETNGLDSQLMHAKRLIQMHQKVYSSYTNNKLYFSKYLCNSMEHLLTIMRKPLDAAGIGIEGDQRQQLKVIGEWCRNSEEIPSILELIEDEFRVLFGSEKH